MRLDTILDSLPKDTTPADRELIERAYEVAEQAHAGQLRSSGDPYVYHCLAVAKILADLNLEPAVIAAGILHDVVEDSLITVADLREQFGPEVAYLVDGVTKLSDIEQKGISRREDRESESLRKMFLAIVNDVRVVLIKFADRLHNMRTLGALSAERRQRIAQETLEIFAPLAGRLGIWRIKWELEDLGFRYLNYAKYKQIAHQIAERRPEREVWLQDIITRVEHALADTGIHAVITGRPQHIYSIYNKVERKKMLLEQLYDVRGVRIIVDNIPACYQVLGIVHSLWKPAPGQFDDYIAAPKDNMYRSLHTAVHADDGKMLEVQIRTREMHEMAEYGIVMHWRHTGRGHEEKVYEAKVSWLRSLITEWKTETSDAREFVDSLKADVFQDRVYAFTPKGKVIDLPAGSTPIDFAYHVHTEIGDRCRGARVNGTLVPLDYQIQAADQVEILVVSRGGPSRAWLNPQLGFVKTQRARARIRQWFKHRDREHNIAEGREILEHELTRLGAQHLSHEHVARLLGYERVEDMLAAIGAADVPSQRIAVRIIEAEEHGPGQHAAEAVSPDSDPRVLGAGDLAVRLAQCCNPAPPDGIVGYVTRKRSVSVHTRDCPYILSRGQERMIELTWMSANTPYQVAIEVIAYNHVGLLLDITNIVSSAGLNMSHVNANTVNQLVTFSASVEITAAEQAVRLMDRIEHLAGVIEVKRIPRHTPALSGDQRQVA